MPILPEIQSEALKWQRRLAQLNGAGINPAPALELARTDLARIAQGGSALPEDQVVSMVYSAYTGSPAITAQPSKSTGTDLNPFHIAGNVMKDASADVRSFIPGLVHEGLDIVNPHKWEELFAQAQQFHTGSISDMAKEVQALPIIGPLIPGMFALSAGTSGITHHPLNFMIDVAAVVSTGTKLAAIPLDASDSAINAALKEGHPVQAVAKATGLEERFTQLLEKQGASKPITDLARAGHYTAAAGLGLTPLRDSQWAYMPVWRAYNGLAILYSRLLHDRGLKLLDSLGLQNLTLEQRNQLFLDASTFDIRYAKPAEHANPQQIADARGDTRLAFTGTDDYIAYTNIDPAANVEAPLFWSSDQARRNSPQGMDIHEVRVNPADISFHDGNYYGKNYLPNKYYTPKEIEVLQQIRTLSNKFDIRQKIQNGFRSIIIPGSGGRTELFPKDSLPDKAQRAAQSAQHTVRAQMLKLNGAQHQLLKAQNNADRALQEARNVFAKHQAGTATDAEARAAQKAVEDTQNKLMDAKRAVTDHNRVLRDKRDLATAAEKALTDALTKSRPTRYNQLVENMVRARVKQEAISRAQLQAAGLSMSLQQAHDMYAEIASRVNAAHSREELASIVGTDTFNRIQEESFNDWQQLISAGYDPIWIHQISPQWYESKIFAHVRPLSQNISRSEVEQVLDYKPQVLDIHARLTGEAMLYFQNEATRQFIDFLAHKTGAVRKEDDIRTELRQRFPEPSQWTKIEKIIGTEYVEWKNPHDPANKYVTTRGVKSGLDKIMTPSGRLAFKTLRPAHHVFEVAVLSGPRHLVHVTVGGLVQVALQEPGTLFDPEVLAHPVALIRALRSGNVPAELTQFHAELQHAIQSGQIVKGMYEKNMDQLHGFRASSRLGNWFGQALDKTGIHTAEEKLNHFENMTTDFYRAAVYIHKLRGGADNEAALAAVNKTLIDVTNMTPFESTVIRNIFPFWSYTKHILRYVLTYPADHPLRASILSHLAQHIEDTDNSGDPARLSKLFFLGQPDASGNVETVDFSNLNPFRSISSVFSWAGFLSGLAPELQLVLRGYGLNTLTGAPDLHQNYTYDAYTGTRTTKRPGISPLDFAGAFIPQAELLDHFFQFSDTMKYLKANDKEAYQRSMFQEMNLPFSVAPINIYDVRAKSAAAQYREAQDALSNAMRTGNTDPLRSYIAVPFEGQLYPADQVANYIDNFHLIFPQFAPKAVIRHPRRRKASTAFTKAISGFPQQPTSYSP